MPLGNCIECHDYVNYIVQSHLIIQLSHGVAPWNKVRKSLELTFCAFSDLLSMKIDANNHTRMKNIVAL